VRTDDWIVRSAGARDLAPLADLMAASPLLQRYGTSRATALAALDAGHRAGDLLLVGRLRGRPVGGLAWVIPSRILTGAAYLRLLLVRGERQRAGLGSRLLGEAEARARRWANHCVLLVTTDNGGARRFYERHGYRHVGDLPGFAVPALDEALYQKALRAPGDRLPV
jgi:GNAT superfamily N-acetyltransferase